MPQFVSHLAQSRREAELIEERCRKAASTGFSGIMGSGAISNLDSQSRRRPADSREQQAHFRGQSFVSIRPIAQRIAGQPIRLAIIGGAKSKRNRRYESRDYQIPDWLKGYGRNEGDLNIVDQHPILDSLHKPAPGVPYSNAWCMKYFTVANLEMTGYSYLWMPKVKGQVQTWYLPSQWVRPIVKDSDLFAGWGIKVEGSTDEKEVPVEEIAAFAIPDPSSPFKALGPMEANAREIMVNEFVIEAQKRAFQLGIHPGALITMGEVKMRDGKTVAPAKLKNWQLEQMVQAIKSRYVGMTHFGEPMFLDRTVSKVEPYGNKPNEMDFGLNADKSRERVEQAFGTNPYIVGAAGMGSRAESAVADAHFCYSTVNPLIELMSLVLTYSVAPRFNLDERYVLFIEPARPRDSEMEQKEWEQGQKYCAVTLNEYRESVLRLPREPWGDAVVVPNGYSVVPVDQLAEGYVVTRDQGPQDTDVDQNPPTNPDNQKPDNQKPPQEQDSGAEGDESGKDSGKGGKAFSKAFDDAFYDKFIETWLKVHDGQETSMGEAIEAFLKEQGDDVASKLESVWKEKGYGVRYKATALELANETFSPADWVDKFKETVKPAFVYAVVAGATHELAAFGDYKTVPLPDDAPQSAKSRKDIGFDINFEFGVDIPADVLEGINKAVDEALSKDYWSDIQETTKDRLETAIKDGLEAGETIRDISKRIKDDVFQGEGGKKRAKTIARSEVTNALNSGADQARVYLHDQGVIEGKEWFATFDGHTRYTHLTANGQQKRVNELFEVGGYSARYPGDPDLPAKERANCRCTAASVTVFTKRGRNPHVKAVLCRGCEVHGI